MKPWGIRSRIRWPTKDAHATIRNFSALSIPDFIAKTVMRHAEEMWVVVVISLPEQNRRARRAQCKLKNLVDFSVRSCCCQRNLISFFETRVFLCVPCGSSYFSVTIWIDSYTTSVSISSSRAEMERGGMRTITSPKGRIITPRRRASRITCWPILFCRG